MLKLRSHLHLAPEPPAVHLGSQLGRKHLDDDLAAKDAVRCHEHSAHSTAAELPLYLVRGGKRGFQSFFELAQFAHGIDKGIWTASRRRETIY